MSRIVLAPMEGFADKLLRGVLTRFATVNRLNEPENLKDFDCAGYAFEPSVSDEKSRVFRRPAA